MRKMRNVFVFVVALALIVTVSWLGTKDSNAEASNALQILLVSGGTYTETSYDVSEEDLRVLFDGPVLASLLGGEPVQLSSTEDIQAASLYLPMDDLASAEHVVGSWGPVSEDGTITCLKCCFGNLPACCCPPEPKDDDPKDRDD